MSGFVYIWFDRKHKRYYVGSHWGLENDGYVCSSSWMKQAYNHRPQDFKRKILSRIDTTRKDLFIEEERFLQMIKPEEIKKKRYYNLKRDTSWHWSGNEQKRLTVGQKISASPNRAANIGRANKGKIRSEEFKEKIRRANLGKKSPNIGETLRKLWQNPEYRQMQVDKKIGKKASQETKEKMSNSQQLRRQQGR
jgi:hypothetical protein